MKKLLFGLLVVYLGFMFLSMTVQRQDESQSQETKHTLIYFRENSSVFSNSCERLKNAVDLLDHSELSHSNAIAELKNTRIAYKKIAFFMDYFLSSAALIYNQPPNPEVEIPFMEASEPVGLQVIESLLFQEYSNSVKAELIGQVKLLAASASDINSLLFNLPINDTKIMESLQLSLIYMVSLEISGFDAPELKSGIIEAKASLETIRSVLQPYITNMPSQPLNAQLNAKLGEAIDFLKKSAEFDTFDRLLFTRKYVLPLQGIMDNFIFQNGFGSKDSKVPSRLFSPGAIEIGKLTKRDSDLIAIGKKFFEEPMLSGNMKRSCRSCHNPDTYFSDGLTANTTFDGGAKLSRNTPTLLYSTLQHSQFWDGRASNTNELILQVLQNPLEMNAKLSSIEERLKNSPDYKQAFLVAFPDQLSKTSTITKVTTAISAYLRTLSPYNSRFDRYMSGKLKKLNISEINGYNLFMGKAQCGTCHFAPVFNGLVPPRFDRNDLEVIGTTSSTNFENPHLDTDNGRFDTYPMDNYRGAFKTPTLRNIAKTAPYMHNGAFKTLEEVIEFYNKGGGAGLGLHVPMQTLSSKPLKLSDTEIGHIVAFLNSLTDNIK